MKIFFVIFIFVISFSCVYACDWTISKSAVYFNKKYYIPCIIAIISSILLTCVHLVLFDKVVLYYAKEFLK